MEKIANYTVEQEAMIRAAAADGPLNLEKATAIAAAMGKKPRSIIAKAIRMDLPYAKRVAVTKTGEPVTRKETLVEKIAEYVAGDLSGLEKASKPALQNVLAALALANADD
jgi:hypothetical protein